MLTIVYGRISSGKTEKIIEKIEEKMNTENPSSILIVPDHATYNYEKRICDRLKNKNGFIDVQVYSFNRFASAVIGYVGKGRKTYLDDCTKTMVIKKCILNCRDKMLVYKDSSRKKGFAKRALDMVSTLENCGYNSENVLDASNDVNNDLLRSKLHDTAVIFSEYENVLKAGYTDNANRLKTAKENLYRYTPLKNCTVFIDGFDVFTTCLYQFIGEIMNHCDVVIGLSQSNVLPIDKNTQKKSAHYDREVYEIHENTYKKIVELAKNTEINYIYTDYEDLQKSEEIKFAENNFYSSKPYKYTKPVNDIHIISYDNPVDEITQIGHTIIDKIKNKENSSRYKDFAILCNDMELYTGIISSVFKMLNIPVYTDKKHDIASHPIALYLFSVLKCAAKGITVDAVSDYLLSELTDVSENDRDNFLSMVKTYGITDYELNNGSKKFKSDDFNELRTSIITPLASFSENLRNAKNAKEISEECYAFLREQNVLEKIDALVDKYEQMNEFYLSDVTSQLWNTAVRLLEDMSNLFEEISIADYAEIIQEGFNASPTSTIPNVIDCVTFGNLQAGKETDKKYVFIVGTLEGVIPAIYTDERLVTVKESEILKDKLELSHSTDTEDARIRYNIYSAITLAKKELYVSYPRFSKSGISQEPSYLLNKFKYLYPAIEFTACPAMTVNDIMVHPYSSLELCRAIAVNKVNSPMAKAVYLSPIVAEDIEKIKYGSTFEQEISETKAIDSSIAEKLFAGKTMSISRFENFDGCPLRHFLTYGIKPNQLDEYVPNNISIGKVVHSVMEKFVLETVKKGITDSDSCTKIAEQIFDEAIEKENHSVMLSTNRQKALNVILRRVISDLCHFVVENYGDYTPVSTESKIDCDIDTGKRTVHVNGKIDRFDILKKDGKNYIRVVDYKKSAEGANLMQLYFYMDKIMKENGYLPGAVENQIFDKNVKRQINEETVTAEKRNKDCISQDDFCSQIDENNNRVNEIIDEIFEGKVSKTKSDENCMFCDYKTVCGKKVKSR